MKKITALILSLVLTLSLSAFAASETAVGLPNPWVEYDSLEAAAESAGFELRIPYIPEELKITAIRLIEGSLLEVVYELDGNSIVYRQGPGEEDVSGDYTEYEETFTEKIEGTEVSVTYKGNGGLVSLMTWQDSGFAYAFYFTPGFDETDAEVVGQIVASLMFWDALNTGN